MVVEHAGDIGRQAHFLADKVDPIAQQVVDAVSAWAAYEAAIGVPAALVDALEWMPQGGLIYAAWAELADLFEAGRVPVVEAHAALRQAASGWLDRPESPVAAHIDAWLSRTHVASGTLIRSHGDFWTSRQ